MKKVIVIAMVVMISGNIVLMAGTIAGTVRKSNGEDIEDIWVEARDYDTDQYRGGAMTHPGGYVINGLPSGNYRIKVSTWNTDYVEEYYNDVYHYYLATPVRVWTYDVVQNINFILEDGLKVSGKVTDKATGSALDNIRVTYWHDDFEIFITTYTDIEGRYTLSRLLPGLVGIGADPESYYSNIGARFKLTEDIDNLDFVLPVGARLSGKVIDAETAQMLPKIEVTYWNDSQEVYQSDISYGDGSFALPHLPPGVAEIQVKPDINAGYASWKLPLGGSLIFLNEGEDKSNQKIPLHKGALVSGYIKNAYGHPMPYFRYQYCGRLCEGSSQTDIDGRYEMRLPLGTSVIAEDEDGYGALPEIITITNVDINVNGPEIMAYSEQTGSLITGSVHNPGSYSKTGDFIIVAFEAGTVIDPNTFIITEAISDTNLIQAGPFTLTKLPQNIQCDVILAIVNETLDEMLSFTVRDFVPDVPVGATDINLYYNSQGSTVTGNVFSMNNQPVLGAIALLSELATGKFAGWTDVDYTGNYVFYNVPAGEYNVTVIHSKCHNGVETVQVFEGEPAFVSPIEMVCTVE